MYHVSLSKPKPNIVKTRFLETSFRNDPGQFFVNGVNLEKHADKFLARNVDNNSLTDISGY